MRDADSFQVLGPDQANELRAFAERRWQEDLPDESERMFAAWASPWRPEALAHYLPLGWSFGSRRERDGALTGFFLGQALLFLRGQTQTLWIEHVEGASPEKTEALVDVAVRAAREKHLQQVLFNDASISVGGAFDVRAASGAPYLRASLEGRGAALVGEGLWRVKTTKG